MVHTWLHNLNTTCQCHGSPRYNGGISREWKFLFLAYWRNPFSEWLVTYLHQSRRKGNTAIYVSE